MDVGALRAPTYCPVRAGASRPCSDGRRGLTALRALSPLPLRASAPPPDWATSVPRDPRTPDARLDHVHRGVRRVAARGLVLHPRRAEHGTPPRGHAHGDGLRGTLPGRLRDALGDV